MNNTLETIGYAILLVVMLLIGFWVGQGSVKYQAKEVELYCSQQTLENWYMKGRIDESKHNPYGMDGNNGAEIPNYIAQ